MKTFAQVAFEAYARAVGDHRHWEELPETTKTAWRATALAVIEKSIFPVESSKPSNDAPASRDELLLVGHAQYSVA